MGICLWSTNAVVARYALQELYVEQIQLLQFSSAAIVFAVIGKKNFRIALLNVPQAKLSYVAGFIGLTGTMIFQYLAFSNAPIIQANIIAYGWPLLVAIYMGIIYWNKASSLFLILPSVTGLIGVSFIISGDLELSFHKEHLLGYIFAFMSALCMAVYTVFIARTKTSSANLLLPASLFGIFVTFIWSINSGHPWPGSDYILMGIYLGVGPMGCGYYFWSKALQSGEVDRIAILGYLTPVCSTSILIFSGLSLSSTAMIGALLVVSSCIFIGYQKRLLSHDGNN